jgi:CheY-like chemotaxis protein
MNELLQILVSTLLTPVAIGLAVWSLWLLRGQIRELVRDTGLKKLEAYGVKAEFSAEEFAEQAYDKQKMGSPSPEDVEEVSTLVQSFSPFVAGRRILWVDNHPENNRLEREALLGWGVDVQTRRTTEEALTELHDRKDVPFDLVISDWYRKGQPEGQRLAEIMREEAISLPILFYFYANTREKYTEIQDKAAALLAVGATSSPRELLRWTFAELVRASLRDRKTSFASVG